MTSRPVYFLAEVQTPLEFQNALNAGVTCFAHQARVYLSGHYKNIRTLRPVPAWIVARALALGFARRQGIRLFTTSPSNTENDHA